MQEIQELIRAKTAAEFQAFAAGHFNTDTLSDEVFSCTETEAFNEGGDEPSEEVKEKYDHKAEALNAAGVQAQVAYLHEQLGSRGLYQYFRALKNQSALSDCAGQ